MSEASENQRMPKHMESCSKIHQSRTSNYRGSISNNLWGFLRNKFINRLGSSQESQ